MIFYLITINNRCPSCTSASSIVRRDRRRRGHGSVQCPQVWPKIPNDCHELLSRGSFTDSSPKDRSAEGVRAGPPLDAPRGAGSIATGDLTLLVVTAVDSSGRLDFGTDNLEVDELFLGLLSAGSGVLLRGTSGSLIISL